MEWERKFLNCRQAERKGGRQRRKKEKREERKKERGGRAGEGEREGEGRKDTYYPAIGPFQTTQSISHWIYCTPSCGSRHSDCHFDFAVHMGILSTLLQWLSATTCFLLFQRPIISLDTRETRSMANSPLVNSGLQRTDTTKFIKNLFPKVFLT